ncbi:MAG TPA: hypothetical protein VJP86_04020 [Vicinamibacterales bacterium]|nr:hypothetical protein [Vicinamibacterales bacterium]
MLQRDRVALQRSRAATRRGPFLTHEQMTDWRDLVRELRRSRFREIEGARAAVMLPISDALITRLINGRLDPRGPVRSLSVAAEPDNMLAVRVTLTSASFLPLLIRLRIVEQPDLPDHPVVTLQLTSRQLGMVAGMALRFLQSLPPGVQVQDDRVVVNVRVLLERAGAADVLDYVRRLEFSTTAGRLRVEGELGM